ncbi:hypothetical protein ACIF9R_03470 [Streptomyces sp. NPDC086080]|uniref:hypothetical protein n=1 Tax=Streptomyces sp. NPDC086080 TaxID=3365748 RepID=UPI0037D4F04B
MPRPVPTRRERRTPRAATAHFTPLAYALAVLIPARHITSPIRRSWHTVHSNQFGHRIAWLLIWALLGVTTLVPLAAYAEGHPMPQSYREQRNFLVFVCFALLFGFRRSWQDLRAHRAPAFLTDTVILCATARHAQGEERSAALEKISKRMRPVERIVRNARRVRMLSLPRSRRREAAKHAHMVVRRLRNTYPKIHEDDGNQALAELASLLMEIADRYAQGRVSALLPASELTGLEPVKDYDTIKLAAAVLTFIATGVSTYPRGPGGNRSAPRGRFRRAGRTTAVW